MTSLYRSNLKRKYQPFLNLIIEGNPQNLVEAGCGAGHITRLLLGELPTSTFTCWDFDLQMLALASNNLAEMEGRARTTVKRVDITARGMGTSQSQERRTTIHSHGVLEHFNDRDIRRIISSQLSATNNLFHCVPSSKYGSRSFGDERLLSPEAWKRVCNPTRIVEFNQGFDLALIWQ
jgi:hypothetical protein